MITTCTVCQARYQLEDDKVPRRAIRVRCPACSGVFSLDGSRLAAAPAPAVSERIEGLEPGFPAPQAPLSMSEPEPVAPPRSVAPPSRTAAPEPVAAPRAAAAVAEPAPSSGGARRRRCKEEMLARALVSDILVYNRDQRDAALRAGNLVEALGPEIKKSWELYKEKVGAEVANSTNHFRDALNEILAEGEKVF